jgi:hypothetical protein
MNTETFWTQVGAYNEATSLVQLGLVIAAIVLTYRVFTKPGAKTDVLMKAFLAFAFAWNGVVFFLIFVRNPISALTGAPLFMVVAALFAGDIFTKKTQFRLPDAKWKRSLTIFWVMLTFLYPLIGWALGHAYPKTCTPMMPCPLTVFALALVAAAMPRVDRKVYVFLLPWALMGLPKCLGALDCYEDCILFAAGVYHLIVLIKGWKARPSGSEMRQGLTR